MEKHKNHIVNLDAIASQYTNRHFVKLIELALDFNNQVADQFYIAPELSWSVVSDVQYVTIKLTRLRPSRLNEVTFSHRLSNFLTNNHWKPRFTQEAAPVSMTDTFNQHLKNRAKENKQRGNLKPKRGRKHPYKG